MFTVNAISNARDYQVVSTAFESRKGFGFPNSCRKTVPGTGANIIVLALKKLDRNPHGNPSHKHER